MSFFTEFNTLSPYLQSVRKLKTYLSFDIHFPNTWKIPKKFVDEETLLENESTETGKRFFSFVSTFNEEEVEKIINNLRNIIKYNKEREEKNKLFQTKVNELKSIFEKQNLDNLQALKFEISNDQKIELEDGEENTNPVRNSN
jgi:hypothetical protein